MSTFEVYGPPLPDEPVWPAPTDGLGLGLDAPATAPTTRTPWLQRLRELSRLAATSPRTVYIERDTEDTIHAHLDVVESILRDPRPELTREMGKYRRRSWGRAMMETVEKKTMTEKEAAPEQKDRVDRHAVLAQLTALLGEVTLVNEEIGRRRTESSEICDLFEERCRGLTRTVAELEDEVAELQADLVEDAVELEGIQGTVHGLHDWIGRLREEHKPVRMSKDLAYQTSRRRWVSRKETEEWTATTDGEMMLDGLSAWMRGWRDVEEGFQARARARQIRRDKRQEQLLRPAEHGTSIYNHIVA
ncbi:uncharacterized protein N7482_003601 [Penicillium canariense]|uniref:Uncharacterized protein n=1 Tax=Penicillium canariense TaxID=189055 RepID=A0A9W9I8V3_9EURO|nr:uncharacterized protein N7482_003601 [Penicillium canariense]KAJ5168007.1 hypothetical protein N7482_003601 [Penicillium canariense]